jgi:anti-sigma factor RsiW
MTDTTPLPEMPCQDIVEVVTAYLEDALSPADRRRFEEHLETCDACVMYVDQIRETIMLTGRTVQVEGLPPDLREDLRAAFRTWSP